MDPTWAVVLGSVGAALLSASLYVCFRFAKRLVEFDELFEMLVHDIETNVRYFESISDLPLLSNAQEVLEADKNMRIMRARMDEYVLRIRELSRRPRPPRQEPKNPPVVI